MIDIVMPQLGETVTEGTVLEWKFGAGDSVPVDSVLLDVETDKAAIEVPTPAEGVLTRILVEAGQPVPVGTVLAQLKVASGKTDADAPSVERQESPGVGGEKREEIVSRAPDRDGSARAMDAARASDRLSPAVRRLLESHKLDATAISATGRDGRLTKADVLAHIAEQEEKRARTSNRTPNYRTVSFNRYRRLTAQHMLRSKAISPHVLQAVEVDFSAVLRARAIWQASPRSDTLKLTVLPFVAFAICRALHEYPALNSSVDGETLRIHKSVSLAIAVDLAHEGLVAPVVHNADDMAFLDLAKALAVLAARAKAGKATPDELTGGTYTISNSGSYGTYLTAPIINQPQVAILSLDGIKKRPVVVSQSGEDSIEIRPVGILAQCFDHRAVDGAYSAAFLQKLTSILESTDWERLLEGT